MDSASIARRSARRIFFGLMVVAAVCLGAADVGSAVDKQGEPKTKTVRLAIDYGDGGQKVFAAVPWMNGQKVLDVLQWADKHPHGIDLEYTGSGSTAFITRIDDLKNEGAGQTAKNWLYWLNGKFAQVGAGGQAVMPGDDVLWKFDVFTEGK
jgi:hypothetical protein